MAFDPGLSWAFAAVGVATQGAALLLFVQFTTMRGERISFSSSVGVRTVRPKGSEVWVLFDPESPQEAELATFRTLG